jgi:hypothetical protein
MRTREEILDSLRGEYGDVNFVEISQDLIWVFKPDTPGLHGVYSISEDKFVSPMKKRVNWYMTHHFVQIPTPRF